MWWFNEERLHGELNNLTPAAVEEKYSDLNQAKPRWREISKFESQRISQADSLAKFVFGYEVEIFINVDNGRSIKTRADHTWKNTAKAIPMFGTALKL